MRTRCWLALVMSYPLVSGCAHGPALKYTAFSDGGSVPQGDYAGLTKFTLARTLLLVQADKAGVASVSAVLSEAVGEGTHYGVKSLDSPGKFALQLTKFPDSNLVRSVSLSVPASPAGIALPPVTAALDEPAVDGRAPNKGLSMALDMQSLLRDPQPRQLSRVGVASSNHRNVAFEVAFGGVPADAIPTRQLDLHRAGNLYFYSACRTATLTFLTPPLTGQRFTVTIADPNYVQTIALAPGQRVSSHAACGVDVTSPVAGSSQGEAGNPLRLTVFDQRRMQAQNLIATWVTRPAESVERALAATTSRGAGKAGVRRAGHTPNRPEVAKVPNLHRPIGTEAVDKPQNALRNTEIRLPTTDKRQSFTF